MSVPYPEKCDVMVFELRIACRRDSFMDEVQEV
jgi:hypothetical protein